MAYAHVAHDCHVGDDTIFGNAATLGGHVTVRETARPSARSPAVHQFCRIGRHAFIGGFSVVTKDALPFAKTVGNRPARNYGLNTIGLVRRRIPADAIAKLRQAYRYLLDVEAQHDAGTGRDRADRRWRARRWVTSSTSSAPPRAAWCCGGATRRPEDGSSRTSSSCRRLPARADRRQRPLPVPRPRRRARAGPPGHRRRHQGRSRAGPRSPPPRRAARRCTGSRSASWARCISVLKAACDHRGGDGRPGQAREDLLRLHARPDAALGASASSPRRTPTALIAAVADVMRRRASSSSIRPRSCQPLLAPAGVLTRRAPDAREEADLAFGYRRPTRSPASTSARPSS